MNFSFSDNFFKSTFFAQLIVAANIICGGFHFYPILIIILLNGGGGGEALFIWCPVIALIHFAILFILFPFLIIEIALRHRLKSAFFTKNKFYTFIFYTSFIFFIFSCLWMIFLVRLFLGV